MAEPESNDDITWVCTAPLHMRVKPLEVQFSKDFAGNAAAVKAKANLLDIHKVYLEKQFATALKGKQDDLVVLNANLKPSKIFQDLKPVIVAHGKEVDALSLRPIFRQVEGQDDIQVNRWVTDPDIVQTFQELLTDLPMIGLHVNMIIEAAETICFNKEKKKQALANAMDIDDGNINVSKDDLKKLIAAAVANTTKKCKPLKKVHNLAYARITPSDSTLAAPQVQEGWKGLFTSQEEVLLFLGSQQTDETLDRQVGSQEEWQGKEELAWQGQGEGQGLTPKP
ncbi:hypothetical protein DXG03_008737 [Asterophora parasitica]|uniref:Uncharacterized protein n=1 Tax=Asterophora parasitica TaxID=117018 RepID=A0A9P7FY43_9AGAR|nr:hypothetical protein DXG03_008737 [Asterophora parasitica]